MNLAMMKCSELAKLPLEVTCPVPPLLEANVSTVLLKPTLVNLTL